MNIKYALKRLSESDYKNMRKQAKLIAKKSGKNSLAILADMFYCAYKYGAGYMDYKIFEFYSLDAEKRATYFTSVKNNELVRRLNRREDWVYFVDKVLFNRTFADFVKRDWIALDECGAAAFAEFIKNREYIILKPRDGMCGKGVEKIATVSVGDPETALREFAGRLLGIAEEVVEQHRDIAAIYPNSLNTLRVITIADDGGIRIMFCGLRIGNRGSVVDNVNNGGMSALIDIETGVITKAAQDKAGDIFAKHPMTGADILGFKIPLYDEALDMVRRAARVVPGVRYVGWDVAISDGGVQLIEGNEFPSNDLTQLPSQLEDSVGLLPRFVPYLK